MFSCLIFIRQLYLLLPKLLPILIFESIHLLVKTNMLHVHNTISLYNQVKYKQAYITIFILITCIRFAIRLIINIRIKNCMYQYMKYVLWQSFFFCGIQFVIKH